MAPFIPERADVYSVRAILAHCKLPNELILTILDHARYWVERVESRVGYKMLFDEEFTRSYNAAVSYLAANAIPPGDPTDAETPKLKEVEFLVVSHDQAWTTENTKGTFQTSSWFEVSIVRPLDPAPLHRGDTDVFRSHSFLEDQNGLGQSIDKVLEDVLQSRRMQLVPRPSSAQEQQRLHCPEMIYTTGSKPEPPTEQEVQVAREGEYAWYLQGNEVGRGTSLFDGEMIRRYTIVWSSDTNPRWVGNDGSGQGKGFVDALREGDCILVWARAKRRGWENHVHGLRITTRTII
ncbi:hypothetical protein HBH68_065720 [Parastagonospora nodorum]|nr:hypothetical protein HBH47_045120 [Parastagonospora nodorum]KAH5027760.1 hypothetical protein HBI74_112060 [Parastagonospora nodorum]KAH5214074.1 hypothetical protein HBH68_065720 [Parastagonospora nodorum]